MCRSLCCRSLNKATSENSFQLSCDCGLKLVWWCLKQRAEFVIHGTCFSQPWCVPSQTKRQDTFCFCDAVLVSHPELLLLLSFQKLVSESKMLYTFHTMITEMDVLASCELRACHEQGRLLFGLHTAKNGLHREVTESGCGLWGRSYFFKSKIGLVEGYCHSYQEKSGKRFNQV